MRVLCVWYMCVCIWCVICVYGVYVCACLHVVCGVYVCVSMWFIVLWRMYVYIYVCGVCMYECVWYMCICICTYICKWVYVCVHMHVEARYWHQVSFSLTIFSFWDMVYYWTLKSWIGQSGHLESSRILLDSASPEVDCRAGLLFSNFWVYLFIYFGFCLLII